MAKQESMNLIEFQQRFTTQDACQQHLFTMKRAIYAKNAVMINIT